ncbi:MAG: Lrp/AsnC family transcriptional regulator [Planctomycetota bacterium]|jgi:DNA-binding Lrp family transcriptional regulator
MAQTEAYVLIHAGSGKTLSAAKAIRGISGVTSAHPVTGLYDVVCRVEADDLAALATTVVDQIQAIDGVERTETALIVQQ